MNVIKSRMKINFIKLAVLIVVFLYACDDRTETKEKNVSETKIETKQLNETHSEESDSIVLNNGSKWKIVPKMMKHIRNMETDVIVFKESNPQKLNEFIQCAEKLQDNIDLLTSNCTMEGPAHDELHKWLVPYMQKVEQLSTAKKIDEARLVFMEIHSSFNVLNKYFE